MGSRLLSRTPNDFMFLFNSTRTLQEQIKGIIIILKVCMELGSYFLFFRDQIKDIIIIIMDPHS
jgi:hypothetical protein